MNQSPAIELAGKRRRPPWLGFAIAGALLCAAAVAISGHRSEFTQAIKSVSNAHPALIAGAFALPLVNWALMGLSFWLLMKRHGPVGLKEVSCLIGAAWLLNYLPLRPGLLGRVAYHKAVHGIPVMATVRVTLTSIACAAAAIALLVLAAVAAATLTGDDALQFVTLAIGPTVLLALAALIAARTARPAHLITTVLLRYADLFVWACRYWIVFSMIDHPIAWPAAGAMAAVVQVAMLVPIVGNGLGLREWTVGLTSAALPPGLVSARGTLSTTIGLAADLTNRLAEVCCAVPVGLLSAAYLARRKLRMGNRLESNAPPVR